MVNQTNAAATAAPVATNIAPATTSTTRWIRRGAAVVALATVGYVAHKFGALDFLKSKLCNSAANPTE